MQRSCLIHILLIILSAAKTVCGDEVDFVRDIRPILQEHCYSCHGATLQKSGLRLDIKSAAFKGGDGYGPSLVAGHASQSPLIELISSDDESLQMPPEGEALTTADIQTLTRWVDAGAIWPDGVDLATLEDRLDHWSFKPRNTPEPPNADDSWARNPIDHFIQDRLRQNGLTPAKSADDVTWLRRVTLDLTGLPPTRNDANKFLQAVPTGDAAYAAVVDRLLKSPRYGERWAQHWLDVVRYADTHGFEVNTERPHAWPYRDYVIGALNADTPYDQFIKEQIVGDALGADTATGFLVTASVLLPGQIGKDAPSIRLARQDSLDEIVNNIGQTFLGLSIGCARCHDHKFDPISAQDYYSMQAFVAGVQYADRKIPQEQPRDQKVFAGTFRKPDQIHLLRRGDPEQPEQRVVPAVLSALDDLSFPDEMPEQQRRLALADWIASAANPLTARVMANRVWQWHFGIGLVETANDFGRNGTLPTHPQLLDWLAEELIESGWSIKHLHRLIVLSSTYRQSTQHNPAAANVDADVRLLWRYPSRRLEAEAIRDCMLAVSGRLNLKMGGRGFDLFNKRGGLTGFAPVESFAGEGLRRMVYAHKVRRERDAVFGAFDCPDAGQSTARRVESTTPIQALNLFNSRITIEEATAFAERVQHEVGDDVTAQIRRVYEIALTRPPTDHELVDIHPIVANYGLPTLCRVVFNSNEFLFIP